MINLNERKRNELKKLKRGRVFSIILSFFSIISISFFTQMLSSIMLKLANTPSLNNIYQNLTIGMHLMIFVVLASISYIFISMSIEASRKIKKLL